ncbi:MAG: FecR protein [Gemmatimonadetes bacterium]|jgi:transmembrane sensor|nr:FecR protein [Gemmatimonadota bacterium]
MPSTVPSRDGDAPAPSSPLSALADEDALRHVFVAEYPALAAEARADLGEQAAGLTPKVVEGAFVRAWDARDRLRSPAELHDFLVRDVHHGAARALSRRAAAHRFSSGGAPGSAEEAHLVAHALAEADVEESWKHVMQALHGEVHSPRALAEAAAAARHEAAEHITVATREQSLLVPLAIGGAALVVAIAVGMSVDRAGTDARLARAVNAADVRVHSSLPAQIGVVSLDDGSRVRIAPETKLSIPSAYGPRLRAVKLEGTASFEVAPGTSEFQVHARDAVVAAVGTAFTVRAYPGDGGVTVAVTEGSVEVRRGGTRQTVTAGSAVVLGSGVAARSASDPERAEADGWRQGALTVAARPLRDVLPELRRWYGLTVLVPDTALLARPVSLRASLDSSRQAIRAIEASAGLEFGYVGQNMVFRERAAAKAAKR